MMARLHSAVAFVRRVRYGFATALENSVLRADLAQAREEAEKALAAYGREVQVNQTLTRAMQRERDEVAVLRARLRDGAS